jgi:hypothetical protein
MRRFDDDWRNDKNRGSFASTVLLALVVSLAGGIAACGGPIDQQSPNNGPDSSKQNEGDEGKYAKFPDPVQKRLEKLPYEVEHFGDGWFAPTRPRLRPGIQALTFPSEMQSDIHVLEMSDDKKTATAALTGEASDKFQSNDGDIGDIVLGGPLNYRVLSVTERQGRTILELENYNPYGVLWGDWKIEKEVFFPKGFYKDKDETLHIPEEKFYDGTEGGAADVIRFNTQRGNDVFEMRKKRLTESVGNDPSQPPPSLRIPFPTIEGSPGGNRTFSHSGYAEFSLGYSATFVFEGEIYFKWDGSALGQGPEGEFKWPGPNEDDLNESWCNQYAQQNFDVYEFGKGVEGRLCMQKIGTSIGLEPSFTLQNTLSATATFDKTFFLMSGNPGDNDDSVYKFVESPCLPDISLPLAGPVSVKVEACPKAELNGGIEGTASLTQQTTVGLDFEMGFMCDYEGNQGCYLLPRNEAGVQLTGSAPTLSIDGQVGIFLELAFGPNMNFKAGAPNVDVAELEFAELWIKDTFRAEYMVGGGEPCATISGSFGPEGEFKAEAILNSPIDLPFVDKDHWSFNLVEAGPYNLSFDLWSIPQAGDTDHLLWGLCPGNREDSDGDGLYDSEEQQIGTDPNSADTDGDGCNDKREYEELVSDPTQADTDGDGLEDCREIQNSCDPTDENTDGDNFDDHTEVEQGYACNDPSSSPSPILLRMEWSEYADIDLEVVPPRSSSPITELKGGPKGGDIVSTNGCSWNSCSASASPYHEMAVWQKGKKNQPRHGTYDVYAEYFPKQPAQPRQQANVTIKVYRAFTWKEAQQKGPFKTWNNVTIGPSQDGERIKIGSFGR